MLYEVITEHQGIDHVVPEGDVLVELPDLDGDENPHDRILLAVDHPLRITSYNVCYTKLLRFS